MKKMMTIIFSFFVFIGVAQATEYKFICLPYAMHGDNDIKVKLNDEQKKTIGPMIFKLDTKKNEIRDAGTVYPYTLTVKTDSGDISVYEKGNIQLFIKDFLLGKEKYQSIGFALKDKPLWTEFICKVEEVK
jgi:hypothetical protein